VLREVADRVARAIPDARTARLGGDEFAMFTTRLANDDDVLVIAERLTTAVTAPISIEGLDLEVGVSIGAAMYPLHASDAAGLLRCADAAMRTAKARHTAFEVSKGPASDSRRRLTLAHDLHQAIDRRELILYYQPKVDLVSGATTGVEALVRWPHPEHGLMAPDEFIPIAEHTGLIGGLTTLVLDQGLAQWRQWNARGIELSIAVNVSARSLTDDDIVDHVSRALVRHRCPSDVLTIEITETQLMSDPEHAAATLNHLHDLGVRISIDDFGTGFSSLSSLRALPIG